MSFIVGVKNKLKDLDENYKIFENTEILLCMLYNAIKSKHIGIWHGTLYNMINIADNTQLDKLSNLMLLYNTYKKNNNNIYKINTNNNCILNDYQDKINELNTIIENILIQLNNAIEMKTVQCTDTSSGCIITNSKYLFNQCFNRKYNSYKLTLCWTNKKYLNIENLSYVCYDNNFKNILSYKYYFDIFNNHIKYIEIINKELKKYKIKQLDIIMSLHIYYSTCNNNIINTIYKYVGYQYDRDNNIKDISNYINTLDNMHNIDVKLKLLTKYQQYTNIYKINKLIN